MRLSIAKKEELVSGAIEAAHVSRMKAAIKSGKEVCLNGHNLHLHNGQPARSTYVVKTVTTGSSGPDAIKESAVPGVEFYSDDGSISFEPYE